MHVRLGHTAIPCEADDRRTGSIKQTAAQFELSINSVKARIRREGWSHE
jgi:hypothetical protein